MGIKRYLGGVVSANPDTPTVESASGVWTIEEANQNIGNWPMAQNTVYDSLKFNSADSAYLSRTPSVAGNQKTWTWSAWVKANSVGTANRGLFSCYNGTSDSTWTQIRLGVNNAGYYDSLSLGGYATNWRTTNAQFRDPSAWYHFVVVWDSTNATAANRVKIYVNGVEETSFYSSNDPALNADSGINQAAAHYIGQGNSTYFSGYMTEINFIDGLALDADYFGFFDANGIWQPRAYKGAYGTNGFYLPMRESATAAGFSTVTYTANASTNKISGVGFSPGFVWCKSRDNAYNHDLYNIISGATKNLQSNLTNSEGTDANSLMSFDPDGFTLGYNENSNYTAGSEAVAWCWDAGSSTDTNNDGTIESQVRANQTYGFSIVTYTGTASSATVGHGLGAAPAVIIVKNRSTTTAWRVYHSSLGLNGSYPNFLQLNVNTGTESGDSGNFTAAPSSTVFSVGNYNVVNGSGNSMVAYAFSEISGYSKFGSYTGNGTSTGPTVDLGFTPAFVLIKNTNTGFDWVIQDSTRDTQNPRQKKLVPNSSAAEDTTYDPLNFSDTGFSAASSDAGVNANGSTYIYMAFADTRAYSAFDDYSGNGNNWQPNNIGTDDVYVDVPTNWGTDTGVGGEVRGNYATYNPLCVPGPNGTASNGNLYISSTGGDSGSGFTSTIPISSQGNKWYWEYTVGTVVSGYPILTCYPTAYTGNNFGGGYLGMNASGTLYGNTGTGTTSALPGYTTGDICMFAYNPSNGKIWMGKNGTWFLSGDPAADSNPTATATTAQQASLFAATTLYNGATCTVNFGQTPFAYTAPSGFAALCTTNLPEPTVADGENYFDISLWTGDDTNTRNITDVSFQPDFTWIKQRSLTASHVLTDAVRGVGYSLLSNQTAAEDLNNQYGYLSAFNSDGFTVSKGATNWGRVNASGETYVAWNWKAGGSGVSNTDGSITSTVSANTTSGFSIVTYTGTGSAATVGHGLGVAPSMIIVKQRSATQNWLVYNSNFPTPATDYIILNSTAAKGTETSYWNGGATDTTFGLGAYNAINGSGSTYVAYCFAPVEGFSAFGSYTGNGSADGPFIFCGFRPSFVMWKRTNDVGAWGMFDSSRDTYNVVDNQLSANVSDAESVTTTNTLDFLSNGFKMRGTATNSNGSGSTYIYMAFAENPFKLSRAR